jgi:hypothetical protein
MEERVVRAVFADHEVASSIVGLVLVGVVYRVASWEWASECSFRDDNVLLHVAMVGAWMVG